MEEQQQKHEMIEHFFHEHPLTRIPNVVEEISLSQWCYGCYRYFSFGDAVYRCSVSCGFRRCLHEECAETAREIRHPVHPSHPLIQKDLMATIGDDTVCAVCDFPGRWKGLVYICSQGCKLWIHLVCAGGLIEVDDEQVMSHPSHPQHELRIFRRKKRSFAFECDACGTMEKGNSYICSICQYLIHESCASLPTTTHFHHHPQHSLSLAFLLPYEYVMYEYTCGICNGTLPQKRWVYHCKLCRYIVHIKCATNTSHAATSNSINGNEADDEHRQILKYPTDDVYEDVIKPFVKREKGEILIPDYDDQITTSYKFHNHKHPLRFTSFSLLSSSDNNNNQEDEDDDGDDDERSELTCDGCTMSIHQKLSTSCLSSSSPSSYSYDNGYMSCGECKYFLHLACFNLPQHIPSHPCHQIKDHPLNLQSSDRQIFIECNICLCDTNGLFYACTKCNFKIDIKCISLPDTIKHAGHPHNDLKQITWEMRRTCVVCQEFSPTSFLWYKCDKCTFFMCCGCALLPTSNKHRLENHLLPLTYDASANHPDEFYCASCEIQMNPRRWMYHFRDCDQSFHPRCIPATSGEYRNFNFGRQLYQVSHHPKHPLRFQLISKKKRCNVCHCEVYDYHGYQCTSCNFVLCPWNHNEDVKSID